MILRGKKVSGPEALGIGLVHELWPLEELKDRALGLAAELAAQPAAAIRGVMSVVVGSEDRTHEELLQAERAAVHATLFSADAQEGVMAFLEKRKPEFNRQ